MATMTLDRGTGVREFIVPFTDPPGGFFATAPAELEIVVGPPPGAQRTLSVRYFPADLEFQLRLFDLVKGTPFEDLGPELSMAAQTGDPVVTFEANAGLVRLLPFRLDSLEVLENYLAANPNLMRQEAYTLASIEVRPRRPG